MADVNASGRWKNHKVNYFSFSSEVLNRPSSQTCGRWYLPTYLFRDGSPKFYGLPETHKVGMPLRPIVSSIGTVTYETSKELARILKPPGGEITTLCKENPRFYTRDKGHPPMSESMHDVL